MAVDSTVAGPPPVTPERFKEMAAPFRGPQTWRSVVQLSLTLILFAAFWAAAYFSLQISYLLSLLFIIPTACFLVRLFMIQHDCGHGSYFKSRRARDTVGFCIGVLTLTPYRYWLRAHAHHHSHTGDLDFRGFGDIDTLTVKEYMKLDRWGRLKYRLYRHPLILFVIGPFFQFLIKHRYPWDIPSNWKNAWSSVWWTNAALVLIVVVMGQLIGYGPFLLIQLPVTLISCCIGLWLFYVQHQYEETYWHDHENWNFFEAALHGSSHLVLPRPLQWLTAYIGLHHVHHLNAQIPNYRLQDCLAANPELQCATKVTMGDTWRLVNLALWDEEKRQLISFRQLRKLQPEGAAG